MSIAFFYLPVSRIPSRLSWAIAAFSSKISANSVLVFLMFIVTVTPMDIDDVRYSATFRPGTFRWRDGKAITNDKVDKEVHQWLVHDPDNAYRHVETTLEPLKLDPALFLRFTDMESTAESFQRFCHGFGPLVDESYFLPPSWSGNLTRKKGASGLPPSALRGSRLDALVAAAKKLRKAVIAWRNGDTDESARMMTGGWRRTGWRPMNVRTEVTPIEKPPGIEILLRPQTLMDALWLQFIFAVIHSKEFRQCEMCSKWFEVTPPVTRTTRMYCGGACRTRATRQREARAKELHAAGRTVSQISKEIGTDKEIVAKWVQSLPKSN